MIRVRNIILAVVCVLVLAGFLLAGTWVTARAVADAINSVKLD